MPLLCCDQLLRLGEETVGHSDLSLDSRMRAPFELGWHHSVASNTPAFVISSFDVPISAMSC